VFNLCIPTNTPKKPVKKKIQQKIQKNKKQSNCRGTNKFLSNIFHHMQHISMIYTDRAADMHKENMKKKRRDLEQASLDAASDLLDTDSNATFAMVLTS